MLATPELIAQAATDLTAIDANVTAAQARASGFTQALLPPAADEVSAGITRLFAQHAEDFQKAAARASAYHDQFAQKMATSAESYASAEAANAEFLQSVGTIIAPTIENGWSLFSRLYVWSASLPQPYNELLMILLTLPLYLLVFCLLTYIFLIRPLILSGMASLGLPIALPYLL
ncbi:MAG: PE family protein [Mycobacterium sp.]|nr:MAG: PE family protein [Mycobacterium sp.]